MRVPRRGVTSTTQYIQPLTEEIALKGEVIFVKSGIHRKSRNLRHFNPSYAHIGQRVANIINLEDIGELRYLPYCQPGVFLSHAIYSKYDLKQKPAFWPSDECKPKEIFYC
jgi:hypothetical protein